MRRRRFCRSTAAWAAAKSGEDYDILANAADHLGDHAFDGGAGLRMLGGSRVRTAFDAFSSTPEVRTRDIAAGADNGGKIVVAGRTLDQDAKAGVGNRAPAFLTTE